MAPSAPISAHLVAEQASHSTQNQLQRSQRHLNTNTEHAATVHQSSGVTSSYIKISF